MLFLNLITLFLVFSFFSISIYGYGKFFKNKFFLNQNYKIGEIGFLGFIFIYLTILILNFFTPIYLHISFTILIISFIYGLIDIRKNHDKENKKIYMLFFLFLLLIATTNNLHDDAYWYHLPYINYIQSHKIILGITNINHSIYVQSIYDIMSIFQLPHYKNKFIYLIPVIFLLYFALVCIDIFEENRKDKNLIFFLVFVFTMILLRYTRSKEYGIDFPVQLLMSYIFINSYLYIKKKRYLFFEKNILFFIFGFFTKINFIFVFPFLFIFLSKIRLLIKKLLKRKAFLILIFLITSLSLIKNYLHSGCLLYPVSKTCVEKNIAEWSSGKKFTNLLEIHLKANSRGYNTYTKYNEDNNLTQPEYLEEFKYKYFKYWIKDKDTERLLIIILIFIALIIPNIFFKKNIKKTNTPNNYIFLLSLCSLFLSFFFGGLQSRYGGNIILVITLFCIAFKFDLIKINNINKFYSFILILGIFFSLSKNLHRIKNEYYESSPINKHSYPIINYVEVDNRINHKFTKNINVTPHPIYCFNIKMLCSTQSTFDSISDIKKINTYTIIISNENKKISSYYEQQNFITKEYYSNKNK